MCIEEGNLLFSIRTLCVITKDFGDQLYLDRQGVGEQRVFMARRLFMAQLMSEDGNRHSLKVSRREKRAISIDPQFAGKLNRTHSKSDATRLKYEIERRTRR